MILMERSTLVVILLIIRSHQGCVHRLCRHNTFWGQINNRSRIAALAAQCTGPHENLWIDEEMLMLQSISVLAQIQR